MNFFSPREERPVTQAQIDSFLNPNVPHWSDGTPDTPHNLNACDVALNAITQLTKKIKEQSMLPAPAAVGNESQSVGKGRTGAGLEWFTVAHLNGQPRKATIKRLIMESTQYSDFAAVIETGEGRQFLLGMRTDKQGRDVYGVLYSILGADETRWPDADFELYPKKSEISGKEYLAVRLTPTVAKKRSA